MEGETQSKSSAGKKIILIFVLVLSLAFVYIFGQELFKTGGFVFSLSQPVVINYIKPANCQENLCNTDAMRTWASDAGVSLNILQSDTSTLPSAHIAIDGKAVFINTGTRYSFLSDLCLLGNHAGSCRALEKMITKTDTVTLTPFTSLFSINDVRVKLIAIQLKQEFGDKINVVPRYIVLSNITDPTVFQGSEEVVEVARQLCVLNEQSSAWPAYVGCIDNSLLTSVWTSNVWSACAETAKVDVEKLNACVSSRGANMVANEYVAARQIGITRTPTVFINNDAYTSSFDLQSMRKAVCLYLKTTPANC